MNPLNHEVHPIERPPMTDPMSPPDAEFRPVSPKLATVRVVSSLIGFAPLLIAAAVTAVLLTKWLWIAFAVVAALTVWVLWLIPRQVRAMAYGIGPEEFLVRKGVMFRSLTLIPYGRIQYVEVSEGPIARAYGIAEIKLHTASAETDATLNGVPAEEAARLRDMLAERGSAELAGL